MKSKMISILLLFIFCPIGLYRIWKYRQFPLTLRIIMTSITGSILLFLFYLFLTIKLHEQHEKNRPALNLSMKDFQVSETTPIKVPVGSLSRDSAGFGISPNEFQTKWEEISASLNQVENGIPLKLQIKRTKEAITDNTAHVPLHLLQGQLSQDAKFELCTFKGKEPVIAVDFTFKITETSENTRFVGSTLYTILMVLEPNMRGEEREEIIRQSIELNRIDFSYSHKSEKALYDVFYMDEKLTFRMLSL